VISSKDVYKELSLKGGGNLMLQSSDFMNWVYVLVQYSWGSFLQTNSRLDASGAALVNEYFSCPFNFFLLEIHALSNSNLS
jgi:hypothetical protein